MASTSNSGSKRKAEDMDPFHGIAPSASTSASKLMKKPSYDVFINHRGPDVKSTLAPNLYSVLTVMGLSVFLDSEELEYGDFLPRTIEAAMSSALLHIAIFSERYAESTWCLAELSFMLKSGARIIPIFYHVDPSDLRCVEQGKGMYAPAFKRHEEKGIYPLEQLHEWKKALQVTSFVSGLVINNYDDEVRALKNIVNIVAKNRQNVPLQVAQHPVGLEEIVNDFEKSIIQSVEIDQGVQIIGIWGMAGSGKTTLAKKLYNEKSPLFERSSFVFNVRDAALKCLLFDKQKVLLNDLRVQGLAVDNIEEGMRILSRSLRYVKVLIVLDDVDRVEQLDALLPPKNSLGKGSLIIVTTRTLDVLKAWGISSIYKTKHLDKLYAKQLFCWHAFLQPDPLYGFGELVEEFLKVCNGLPLSIKILGAQLYGVPLKETWQSLLDKISKILPDDIQQTLKISYDSLVNEEKEMFLDAACFFIGEEISLALEVWNGMGYVGLLGFETLLHRSLIDLDDNNFITMDNHTRDLGRIIAHEQSSHRLWFPNRLLVSKNNKRKE